MQAASKIPEDRASIHTGPGKKSTRQRQLTLLAMCIAQGMILLDVTIVNIALPSIQRELHESSSELEWVISLAARARPLCRRVMVTSDNGTVRMHDLAPFR